MPQSELEPTELERCLPQCDSIICNKTYAPVCAVGEPGAKQDRGVTFANECEAHRRGCLTKQSVYIRIVVVKLRRPLILFNPNSSHAHPEEGTLSGCQAQVQARQQGQRQA